MSFNCEIIADSLSLQGDRLTTFVVTYPRIIHSEMCRHRMFSRNTASSRAIPFKKMVKDVMENPFIPIAWQKDHKGMQGTEYFTNENEIAVLKYDWLRARDEAVDWAKHFSNDGITKQLCNRLLEPFVWVTEIITGTEWANFFELRCPQYVVSGYPDGCNPEALEPYEATFRSRKDAIEWLPELENFTETDWLECNESQAEIHIQKIAELMWDSYNESTPKQLEAGEWHIPFGDKFDLEKLHNQCNKEFGKEIDKAINYGIKESSSVQEICVKIATARCARISYLNFEGKDDYEADIKLHDRLKEYEHASPFEHCAKAMTDEEYASFRRGEHSVRLETATPEVYWDIDADTGESGCCRNFRGFIQYRYLIDL